MSHSDFSLKSVLGVGFYFFRGVLESECPNHMATLIIPIKNLKCIKSAKSACADIQNDDTVQPSFGLRVSAKYIHSAQAFSGF